MVDWVYIDNYIRKLKISKKIASEAFTASPTGIIDISRIIDQKPDYYVKPAPDTRELNQTIIFSDWTHYSYTPYQKELAEALLQRLLDEKFEIYVWTNHQFERLEKTMGIIKSQRYIKPILQDEMKPLAVKQLKKSIDELHVLDDQEMRRLFYPDNEALQSCVSLACLIRVFDETIKNYVIQNRPKGIVISELVDTRFYQTNTTFKSINSGLPELKTLPIYFKLLDIKIRPKAPTGHENVFLEAIQLGNLKYTDESVQNVTSAEIDLPSHSRNLEMLSTQFHQFIQAMPHLNQLSITNLSFAIDLPDSIQHLDIYTKTHITLNVHKVKSLSIHSNSSIDENRRVTFIFDSPQNENNHHSSHVPPTLKKLTLYHCDLTEPLSIPLNRLEVLKLQTYNQTHSSLLQNCPKIKELSLKAETEMTYPQCQLASLETCQLEHMYSEDIQKIISDSPKLNTLKLKDILFKNREKPLDLGIYAIKTLELSSKCPQTLDYAPILMKATHLENLTLEVQQVIIGETVKLPNLKSLSIHHVDNFSRPEFHLQNLLTETPNLESLHLSQLTINDTFNYNLPSLKSLHIKTISTKYPLLKQFIQDPQIIETIFLRMPHSEDIHYLIEGDFPHLRELTLDAIMIDLEEFKNFVRRHLEYQVLNSIHLERTPQNFQNDIELIELLKNIPNVYGMTQVQYIPKRYESSHAQTATPMPRGPKTNQMASFDADTTPYRQTFHIKEIFQPLDGSVKPLVNHYRLETFGILQFGNTSQPFKLSNHEQQWDDSKKPIQVKNITEYVPNNPQGYFHGKQTLQASSEWQALASLFPNETLSHFQVNSDIEIEIAYSERDNLYYAKCHKTVELNFLLHHPTIAHNQLPKEILDLIEHFNQFEAKALENPPAVPEELLKAILKQQVGACRHRAAAFKYLMDQQKIPARIITNDCHAYVEIKYHDQWHRCELGGYPTNLNVYEIDEAVNTAQNIVSSQTARAEKIIREIPMEYVSEKELLYRQQFRPEPPAIVHSLNEFIFPLLNGEKPKQLIHAPVSTLQALGFAIQHTALATRHQVFYIDSPDDLVCSARVFKRKSDNFGEWHPKGGKLYDFIQATQTSARPPVLIINYAKFSADDIARISNSLYDKTASADGTPIRPDTLIMGLSDPELPTSYTGADFYSRFDKINDFPIHLHIPTIVVFQNPLEAPSDCYEINLFSSPNWKNKLFGGWTIIDNIPIFVPGALEKALATGRAIKIINPPDDPDFEKHWTQARITGVIQTPDCCFNIPPSLHIFTESQIAFHLDSFEITEHLKPEAKVLNPTLVSHFFNQYQFKDGKLSQTPGYIEEMKGLPLAVFLTRDLSIETWNELFSNCKDHGVKLEIACAPDIQLPDFLSTANPVPALETPFQAEIPYNNICIYSKDIDYTLHQLPKDEWITIDISELKISDLVQAISGKIEHDDFVFTEKKQALCQLLEAGKNVILKGEFSNQLQDELVDFIRNRDANAPGRLLLISSTPISGLGAYHTHSFEAHDLLQDIPADIQSKIPKIEQLTFAELQTQVEYLKNHPNATSAAETFKGLEKITQKIRLAPFHPDTTEQDTIDFIHERKQLIEQHLEHHPYVFIAGLTGVGKSRFIESELSQDHHVHIGENLECFKRWAQAPGDTRQILFIDEANLSTRQWSEFEGLFQQHPGVVIDGEYHALSKNHKVIFAGNPLNYGDDRQLSPLFARHGNAVVFSPLSPAFIYEKVIKDIFKETTIDLKTIGGILIDYYKFVTECSEKEVLITPRQVQMIAVLIKNFAMQHTTNDADIETMAHYYAQQIVMPLVPDAKQNIFKTCFPVVPRIEMESPSENPISTSFCHTPSRLQVRHQLKDFLGLQKSGINEGLNRLVLDGEAGIGKTEMIIDVLLAEGYRKGNIEHPGHPQTFYHIPASMNQKQKKDILLKAFDEGAIVLIDEINSVATMEKLLNSILDNKHPDTLKKAKTPGFRLIGTQNPAYYAGRNIDSPALASRTIYIQIPPYPKNEMITILKAKDLPDMDVKPLVNAFEYMRQPAIPNGKRHIPSFRDLIKKADAIISAHHMQISTLYPHQSIKSRPTKVLFEIYTEQLSMRDEHTGENRLPPTHIYAMSDTPIDKHCDLQRNDYEEEITNQTKLSQFYSASGLEVYSPNSKESYALGEFNHQTRAILTTSKENIDYLQTTLTIMNMIENILARGNTPHIITEDPILAKIADDYIDYLKNQDLTCQYQASTTDEHSEIEHAENLFHLILEQVEAPNTSPPCPWFVQALEQRPELSYRRPNI